jgi:hypothetical protein
MANVTFIPATKAGLTKPKHKLVIIGSFAHRARPELFRGANIKTRESITQIQIAQNSRHV